MSEVRSASWAFYKPELLSLRLGRQLAAGICRPRFARNAGDALEPDRRHCVRFDVELFRTFGGACLMTIIPL